MSKKSKPMTHWHQLLAELFRLMLSSLDVEVHSEVNVLTKPPRADILLIRRHTEQWTEEQLKFIPSGIRDSRAPQILIEFKKTESLIKDAISILVAYHLFYCKNNHLDPDTVLPVLLVSIQPKPERLAKFGFEPTNEPGVYRNTNFLAERILLLTLNELESTLYNAFVQFFASQKPVRQQALQQLQAVGLEAIPQDVYWYATSVWHRQASAGDNTMEAMTTEQIIEDGKQWARLMLKALPPQDLLALFVPEEPVADFSPEQFLQGQNVETIAMLAQQWMKQGREQGREQGLAQGRKQGREDGVEQVARRLLASHDVVTVSEWTGLTIERVEQLKQQLDQDAN